jgi:hypothetical protein
MKKKKVKAKWDEGMETVVRRWEYLPGHVRRTIAEMVLHYGPAAGEARFATPVGAEWDEVEIVVCGADRARITVRGVTETYTFKGLGLEDKRRPGVARAEWRMLRTYAENPEPDAYYRLPKRRSLKVEISQFRRWLRAFFGIPGDPLKPFRSMLWLPRFKIRVE